MLICRKCNEPAMDSRRDYANESITIFYRHADQREHAYRVQALDAERITLEDKERVKVA